MGTFYEQWLATSARVEEAVRHSPVVARGRDLAWVETPQDARVAMLVGPQVGFPTQGTALLKAEIPGGWHTGRHAHGEESIHVLSGSGFAVVDGARYDWKVGTTLHIPFMAEHQLFNTGDEPAVYVSAVAHDLDLFTQLGRLVQLEEKGPNPPQVERRFPAQASQLAEDGRRIALHLEDAIDENALRDAQPDGRHAAGQQGHRHGGIWILMGGGEGRTAETNGFRASATAMTHIFEELPRTSSHKHAHTEAMLYVLEGTGYSEIDGKRYDWEAGDAVHVPPKMTVHQHFNPSAARTRTLRIEFGIRYFYEALWKGFHKVEHRLHAAAL